MTDDAIGREVEAEARRQAAPDEPSAGTYLDLGRDYLAESRLPHAAASFEAAVRRDPKNLQGHFALGQVRLAAGDIRGAIGSFRVCADGKGSGLIPELEDPWLQLGYCHEQAGESGEAARRFQESLRANPRTGENAVALGALWMREGRHPEAETIFREAGGRMPTRRDEFEHYAGLAAEKKRFSPYLPGGTGVTMRINRALDAIDDLGEKDK